jgi:hypothetical protein
MPCSAEDLNLCSPPTTGEQSLECRRANDPFRACRVLVRTKENSNRLLDLCR